MKHITDAKVFASQGRHHWYLALLAQNYQRLAEQSLATSKLYFRFLQTKYGDALVTELALLTPVSDTLRYLS